MIDEGFGDITDVFKFVCQYWIEVGGTYITYPYQQPSSRLSRLFRRREAICPYLTRLFPGGTLVNNTK